MAERALTERPPFDVERYARESETRVETASDSERTTVPPPPEHTNLRESCKDLLATIAPQPDERPSGVTLVTSTPTLGAVAVRLVSGEDLEWFELDEVARAIVAAVDDRSIVEDILAATKTPISDGVAVFAHLARLGVVAFRAA